MPLFFIIIIVIMSINLIISLLLVLFFIIIHILLLYQWYLDSGQLIIKWLIINLCFLTNTFFCSQLTHSQSQTLSMSIHVYWRTLLHNSRNMFCIQFVLSGMGLILRCAAYNTYNIIIYSDNLWCCDHHNINTL